MLTWAFAFLAVKKDWTNGVHLVIAMICDVAIFHYIAEAIR